MQAVLTALIVLFGAASYVVGARAIITGRYAPSVFSRIVWLVLAAISFAGVVASSADSSARLLSGIFLVGNAVICALSFWKGTREIGRLEYVCLAILAVGGIVWAVSHAPVLGLVISLVAHLVGGSPTYRRVLRNPASESGGFWSLFFIASACTLLSALGEPWPTLIFPTYFVLFDGGMTVLALRRRRPPRTSPRRASTA